MSKENSFGPNPLSQIMTPNIPKVHIPDYSTLNSQINPAKWSYERLVEYINDFESELDSEQEIGARLVSFGSTVTFHIQDIGYYGPDIITFYGINDRNEKIQLIQNISQLSVLLIAMKKIGEKARRIGFELINREEKS